MNRDFIKREPTAYGHDCITAIIEYIRDGINKEALLLCVDIKNRQISKKFANLSTETGDKS